MSRGKSYAVKMKNHQWRRSDPFDELWFSRVGHRPNESLYGTADTLDPQSPQPWSRLPGLPLAAMAGSALLESRMHALVGAMAAFTPAPPGLAPYAVSFGQTIAPLTAVDASPRGMAW